MKNTTATIIETPQPLASPESRRGLTVQEAAKYLSTTVPAIRQLIYRRELAFVKIGKRHIIDRQDLDKWIEKRKHVA
jgi:excisionase family DNA binding protein